MKMAAYITSYLRYRGLDERGIRAISGALINRLLIDQAIPPEKHAEIVYDTEIPLDQTPITRVIKMSNREHVERFFDDGTLQLGDFRYFNNFDHEEIGDRSEGTFCSLDDVMMSSVSPRLAADFTTMRSAPMSETQILIVSNVSDTIHIFQSMM